MADEVAVDLEDTVPDQDATGAAREVEEHAVDLESVGVEANLRIIEEEAGPNQGLGRDTGVRKKDQVLTRQTQFSKRFQV